MRLEEIEEAVAAPRTDPVKIAEKVVYRYLAQRRRLPDRRAGYAEGASARCICLLGIRTARSGKSSSTCTRKGLRSAV